eukprot:CAMPEP_0113893478 /NCGR_PEP_ID=MMETSP0780_2-20120614/16113_1 /TAXON_ID=652834 /ORGANISM="Palpitomonas bilix" /LENGTH=998 /DNA_ID=CAMNT_0000883769 /DNA_START=58 /DNA_END=3054 /DNA_ORIENTATION=+ /assembly_acc=CAM_ASM_000599
MPSDMSLGIEQHPAVQRVRDSILHSRCLNVFLSSPFGGMDEEREELVRVRVPALRTLCEEKSVTLTFVDLRWGISEKQAQESLILKICLQAVERAQVFVGMYGARYGSSLLVKHNEPWLRPTIEMCYPDYPWLSSMPDRSLTEYEFRHACLNDPTRIPSLFYFRDLQYDRLKVEEARSAGDSLGVRAFEVENEASASALASIREEVASAADRGLVVCRSDYADPESGVETLSSDLSALLSLVLPSLGVLYEEKKLSTHRAFAQARNIVYVGGEKYLSEISTFLSSSAGLGLLVEGASGGGKSSLLSRLLLDRVLPSSDTFNTSYHFCGCTSQSTQLGDLLDNIAFQVYRTCDKKYTSRLYKEEEFEDMLAALIDMWADTRVTSDSAKTLVIVLDALNQLQDSEYKGTPVFQRFYNAREGRWDEGERTPTVFDLQWLPTSLSASTSAKLDQSHSSVKFVVSTLPGKGLDVLHRRMSEEGGEGSGDESRASSSWRVVGVQPLTVSDRKALVEETLRLHHKQVDPRLLPLWECDQSRVPLFLVLALQETISFGQYEKVGSFIQSLVSRQSIPDLLELILERLEESFSVQLVSTSLRLIVLSSVGLEEDELVDLLSSSLGQEEGGMFRALKFALNRLLIERSGRLIPGHDYIRTTILHRYVQGKGNTNQIYQAYSGIAAYFYRMWSDGKRRTRALDELPESAMKAELWQEYSTLICDDEFRVQKYGKDTEEGIQRKRLFRGVDVESISNGGLSEGMLEEVVAIDSTKLRAPNAAIDRPPHSIWISNSMPGALFGVEGAALLSHAFMQRSKLEDASKGIQTIDLTSCAIRDAGLSLLLTALRGCSGLLSRLRSFLLANNSLTSTSSDLLISHLSADNGGGALECLDLSFNEIPGPSCVSLGHTFGDRVVLVGNNFDLATATAIERSIQEGGREYPFQPEPYDTYLMDNPAIYDILEKKPSTYVVTADDMKKHYIKTTGITSRMVGLNEDFSLRLYDTGKSGRM